MHFIIGAVGTSGDTLPLIGLGRVLHERGHDVDFIGLHYFAERVRHAGLTFHPVGEPLLFERLARDPAVWDWHTGFRELWNVLNATMPATFDAVQRLRRAGTALVGSSGAVGMRIAQDVMHLPHTTVHMSPFYLFSVYENCLGGLGAWPRGMPIVMRRAAMRMMDKAAIDAVCARDINRFRHQLGLPAQRALMTRWIHSPYRTVCAVPDWFGAAQPDWPASARQVDFPVALGEAWTPPAALEAFLATGTRPLVVSACTGAGAASTFFLRAIEAATQLGERVVVVSRFLEQIPRPLPPTAMLIDYAPFDWLLPRTRGLIHNGGIGTSVLAMRAGIPQIVVPFAYDQYYNAMRLAALGVSVTVRRQRSATELADAAQKLLASPSTVSACERLRGATLNASGGLQALADLVESAPVIQ